MPGINLAQFGPTIIYFIIIIAVFYFILIRPQRKKDKEHKNMVSSLRKGDKIVTIGGFHGKVISAKGDVMTVMLGDNKVKLEKWAIKSVTHVGDDDDLLEEAEEEETSTEAGEEKTDQTEK